MRDGGTGILRQRLLERMKARCVESQSVNVLSEKVGICLSRPFPSRGAISSPDLALVVDAISDDVCVSPSPSIPAQEHWNKGRRRTTHLRIESPDLAQTLPCSAGARSVVIAIDDKLEVVTGAKMVDRGG